MDGEDFIADGFVHLRLVKRRLFVDGTLIRQLFDIFERKAGHEHHHAALNCRVKRTHRRSDGVPRHKRREGLLYRAVRLVQSAASKRFLRTLRFDPHRV